MEESTITLRTQELNERVGQIREGLSLREVRLILGGNAFKTEQQQEKVVYLWRFQLLDNQGPGDPYEIYMGEFEDDRLLFGSVLPQG